MTTPLDPLAVAGDAAEAPVAPAAATAPLPRNRGPRWLRWWLMSSLAVALVLLVCLAFGLGHVDVTPLHIVIDGDDVASGLSIDAPTAAGQVLVAAVLIMVALLVVLMVPLLLMLVLGAVAVALVIGFGVPLAALALALTVVTSPLWLVGLGVWALMRRRGPAPAVTMHA